MVVEVEAENFMTCWIWCSWHPTVLDKQSFVFHVLRCSDFCALDSEVDSFGKNSGKPTEHLQTGLKPLPPWQCVFVLLKFEVRQTWRWVHRRLRLERRSSIDGSRTKRRAPARKLLGLRARTRAKEKGRTRGKEAKTKERVAKRKANGALLRAARARVLHWA